MRTGIIESDTLLTVFANNLYCAHSHSGFPYVPFTSCQHHQLLTSRTFILTFHQWAVRHLFCSGRFHCRHPRQHLRKILPEHLFHRLLRAHPVPASIWIGQRRTAQLGFDRCGQSSGLPVRMVCRSAAHVRSFVLHAFPKAKYHAKDTVASCRHFQYRCHRPGCRTARVMRCGLPVRKASRWSDDFLSALRGNRLSCLGSLLPYYLETAGSCPSHQLLFKHTVTFRLR